MVNNSPRAHVSHFTPSLSLSLFLVLFFRLQMALQSSVSSHQPLAKRHKSPFAREVLDEVRGGATDPISPMCSLLPLSLSLSLLFSSLS
jgi:hypothetical protein